MNELSKRVIFTFDRAAAGLAEALRSELRDYEDIHNVNLELDIDGRVDGDLRIGYRLSLNYENSTKGGKLAHVLAEAVRRFDWCKTNAVVCLPKVSE